MRFIFGLMEPEDTAVARRYLDADYARRIAGELYGGSAILAALIPRAQLHVYHGGHLELVIRPGLLAPVVAGFLAQPSSRIAR